MTIKNAFFLVLLSSLATGCANRSGGAGGMLGKSSLQPAPPASSTASPVYPREAALKGIEGWVKVGFTITKNGGVENAFIVESQPEGVFDQAALVSIEKWRFKPTVVNGVAVETPNQFAIIDFKIGD